MSLLRRVRTARSAAQTPGSKGVVPKAEGIYMDRRTLLQRLLGLSPADSGLIHGVSGALAQGVAGGNPGAERDRTRHPWSSVAPRTRSRRPRGVASHDGGIVRFDGQISAAKFGGRGSRAQALER